MKKWIASPLLLLFSIATYAQLSIFSTTSNPSCNTANGTPDGTITTQVTGGLAPYLYQWTTTNGSGLDQSVASQTGLEGGTYVVTVTDANGLTESQTFTLRMPRIISILAVATDPDCSANGSISIQVNGGTGEYSYTWSTADGTGIEQGANDQTGLTVGTYKLDVTDTNACQQSAHYSLIEHLTNVQFTSPVSKISVTADPFTLVGGLPLGGSYTGTGVVDAQGTFDPSIAGVGIHTITYTYEDGNGCKNSATIDIEVQENAIVSFILDDNEACIGEVFDLSGSGSPQGGTFSGSGITGNIFDSETAGIGVHTLTYTYTDNNGIRSAATSEVIVYDVPVVELLLHEDKVCVLDEPFALEGGLPLGGTYSGTAVRAAELFDPSAAGIGTHVITYTFTDQRGCVSSATDQISVGEENCTQTSSVAELQNETKIFPNPAQNVVYIESQSDLQFSVTDISGKQVLTGFVLQGKNAIDISNLSQGLFLLSIENENSTLTKKLIVN